MKEKLYKKCSHCQGTGKIKNREPLLQTPDTKRMLKIMKKHELTQLALAKILDISQGTISGWFRPHTNLQGKIKSIYFDALKMKGYK